MTQLQIQLESYRTQLSIAERFLLLYESKLPEGLGNITINGASADFGVFLESRSNDERNRALQLLGEVFGRDEWKGTLAYSRRYYDWDKTVEGVSLHIYSAQKIDQPDTFPVSPAALPILLQDAEPSGIAQLPGQYQEAASPDIEEF